jgi:hypothetical protein
VTDSYVAFYWTRPVYWAGFARLDRDLDRAAAQSRTIRYQMLLVRDHVEKVGGQLVREVHWLEQEPDRASDLVGDELKPLRAVCSSTGAVLLYVDFSKKGWRDQPHLLCFAEEHGIATEGLCPEPVMMDGRSFDPIRHFSMWKRAHDEERSRRRERVAHELPKTYARYANSPKVNRMIADELNATGCKTVTGRSWTADTVRKEIGKMKLVR